MPQAPVHKEPRARRDATIRDITGTGGSSEKAGRHAKHFQTLMRHHVEPSKRCNAKSDVGLVCASKQPARFPGGDYGNALGHLQSDGVGILVATGCYLLRNPTQSRSGWAAPSAGVRFQDH